MDTGWPRDFILWRMSLPELRVWQHCQLKAQARWTVEPVPATAIDHQNATLDQEIQSHAGQFQA